LSERIRNYELIITLSPVANEDEASNILEGISGYIKEQGGEVENQEIWGVRRLAFPINDYQEGNYVKTQLKLNSLKAQDLDKVLKANQEVLVHMLTRV
jgi:small subunit ribosomal protein S6|tara:strand:+ start:303 stop:596 length:294 start_codon:yes stop_codon:yes gene_type:complete